MRRNMAVAIICLVLGLVALFYASTVEIFWFSVGLAFTVLGGLLLTIAFALLASMLENRSGEDGASSRNRHRIEALTPQELMDRGMLRQALNAYEQEGDEYLRTHRWAKNYPAELETRIAEITASMVQDPQKHGGELYKQLTRRLLGDRGAADRLIQHEHERRPNADLDALLRFAIERLNRDRR